MAGMKGPQYHTDLLLLESAVADGRRMIERGERPVYELRVAHGRDAVTASVVQLPTLEVTAVDRDEALTLARALIAQTLSAHEDSFDLEVDG
jgi:hypothetical protein